MADKYKVVDNEFNRANYPDLVGEVLDTPPTYANVELVKDRKSMEDIFKVSTDDAQMFAVRCFRAGYYQDEIVAGISELFNESLDSSKKIFNGAIMQMTKLGPYSKDKKASGNSWYKKAQSPRPENEFVTEVTPSVGRYGFQDDIDVEGQKVNVPFIVDIEAKSWGIKGVSAYAVSTIMIPLTITEWVGDDTVERDTEIQVDLSKLPDEHTHYGHGVYTVQDIELSLGKDFQVIYDDSSISFSQG